MQRLQDASDALEYQRRRKQQNRLAQKKHRDIKKQRRNAPQISGEAESSKSASGALTISLSKESIAEYANDIDYTTLPCWMLVYFIVPSPRSPSFQLPCVHLAKAVYENTRRLGIDYQVMSSCDGRSYIAESCDLHCEESHSSIPLKVSDDRKGKRRLCWSNVPDNMHPTSLQLNVPHHPFIDVAFVWPTMREKILYLCDKGLLNDKHLCKDTLSSYLPGAKLEKTAFILYGDDPMDEEAWEVGQEWANKYCYLLDDKIIRRTNWWRRQRGLPVLHLPPTLTSTPSSTPVACR